MNLRTLTRNILLSGGDILPDGQILPVIYEVDFSLRHARRAFSLHRETAPLSGFQGFCLERGRLYIVTLWEFLVLDARDFTILLRVAHPRFNQLHHAMPYRSGYALANTKRDEILFLDKSGAIEHSIHLTLGPEGCIYGEANANPNQSDDRCHPNFLFSLTDGSLYATLLRADCAVNVHAPEQRFHTGALGHPHAGHIYGNQVYFVTTEGFVSIHHKGVVMPVACMDMGRNYQERTKIGIPKGLLIDDGMAIVVFDRYAPKNGLALPDDWRILPSRVSVFELCSGMLVDEIVIGEGCGQLFSVSWGRS